jgi:UDP-N-acetylglucosamine--N-acetylmuramyl-(pentapeptide) pyrophosphoryl-undecaprenol N-acetylglucosamine transferase
VKILITSSISGGHLFPAIAVAQELKKRDENCRILFVTGNRNVAMRIVGQEGFSFVALPPFFKPTIITVIPLVIRFLENVIRSLAIVRRERPDVVVGFGGLLSGPVMLCACVLRIPTVIHEQNIVPGRTNRVLGRWVEAIAVSFKESIPYFRSENKSMVTGNPIRRTLAAVKREDAVKGFGFIPGHFTLFVMGGSQGAHSVNQAVVRVFERFAPQERRQFQVVHITGEQDQAMVQERYKRLDLTAKVYSFMEHIDAAYAASDLIISRAGASAISEIAFLGKNAVLIPYPYARSHQLNNARYMAERNSAVVLEDNDDLPGCLYAEIQKFYNDKDYQQQFSHPSQYRNDAAEGVAELIANMH